jgi:hypothetical protein
MSTVQIIFRHTCNEDEAYDALRAELQVREEHGLTADLDEIKDALDAIEADWDAQQQAEINAENGFELYLETRYADEYAAFDAYERSIGAIN